MYGTIYLLEKTCLKDVSFYSVCICVIPLLSKWKGIQRIKFLGQQFMCMPAENYVILNVSNDIFV